MTRKCKVCRAVYVPTKPMQTVCGHDCAMTLATSQRAKAEKVDRVKEKNADRVKREKMKTRGDLIREAQAAFNSFIRARDAGKPCICCGRYSASPMHGGEWDAGHYRSRGSAPHLRFDERNVHAQLKQCNRYASGNVVGYRVGLIERLGADVVDALECDQVPRDYTHDQLREIKATYSVRARELRKAQE